MHKDKSAVIPIPSNRSKAMEVHDFKQATVPPVKMKKFWPSIEISDELKPKTANSIRYLKEKGVKPVILSGDHFSKTKEIADQLGIKDFFAEKLPAEKLAIVEELNKKEPTAMVGDGINDAPASGQSYFGNLS